MPLLMKGRPCIYKMTTCLVTIWWQLRVYLINTGGHFFHHLANIWELLGDHLITNSDPLGISLFKYLGSTWGHLITTWGPLGGHLRQLDNHLLHVQEVWLKHIIITNDFGFNCAALILTPLSNQTFPAPWLEKALQLNIHGLLARHTSF